MALRMPKSEGEALRLLQSLGGRCAEKALVFAALPLEMKTSTLLEELRRDCRMKPVSKLKVTSYGHDMLTLVPPDMLVDDSITSKSSFVRHRGAPSHSRYYRDIPENSVALEDHMNRPTPEKDFLNHDLVERTRTYGLTEEGRLKVLRLAFDELFPDLELEGLCFDRPEGWGSRKSKIFARLYDRNLDPDDFDVHAERLAAVFGPEAITWDDSGSALAAEFMGVPTDVLVRFDLWMGKRSPLGRILAGDLRPVPERPWVNPTKATSPRKPSSPTGNNIIPSPKGRGQKARDKGLNDVDKRRLEKLRANLAKLIGEPIVPPGFIERMRDEIRAIAAKLKE